jgi:hypothetical protein
MQRILSSNWRDIHLSEHFTLGECVVSSIRRDLAEKIIPTIEQVNNLFLLCHFGMQPTRNAHGMLKITRGLTSQELNEAVGGAEDSQHFYGEALDFIPLDESPLKVFLWIKEVLRFKGELFYYEKRGHIHMALKSLWVKHTDQKIILT